ncbi:hypothetical protein GYA28_01795 [Candidatus Roizmanbacteria bacterium]|jgi:hypothetical protein|nr:hypothetical protein [Candidatus Roizmanbacteria bacterium]
MNETIHIYRKILRNGIEIKIKRKKYQITYPNYIWERFPGSLHKIFADSLSYIATWHLPLAENKNIVYHFNHPPIEPVFFKMLFYSIPMNIFEFNNITTSDILQKFYNANFKVHFKGLNHAHAGKIPKRVLKEKSLLFFSFGKDSLLTYGLLKELGVSIIPVFMREPQSAFENAHKKKLADNFYKKFSEEVLFFPLTIGRLRQTKDLYWGWDLLLSQYAFVLVPFYFYYQTKYLFFGNEQSCNYSIEDGEGYLINPVFEQSIFGMQHLQDIPKQFFINTHVGSLVEPIHEIFITYILHRRYPEIGHFQMSCFSEEPEAKKRRWCTKCEKCARMYIFLKALNISPERVGFYNNHMLEKQKEGLYTIFNQTNGKSAYGGSGLGKDEQLLAFYLAYKNGVKGPLINKFKRLYLKTVLKKKDKLIKEYFGIHSSLSLPSSLRRKTLAIIKKEQRKALDYVHKLVNN